MSNIIHYSISDNEKYVTFCSRITKKTTRELSKVTCKQCKSRAESNFYSYLQFINEGEKI